METVFTDCSTGEAEVREVTSEEEAALLLAQAEALSFQTKESATITLDQFRSLFTATERKAIRDSTNDNVIELWEKAMANQRINRDSQEVRDGLAYLEATAHIAEGRAETIRTANPT